jgi:hypothetical protein
MTLAQRSGLRIIHPLQKRLLFNCRLDFREAQLGKFRGDLRVTDNLASAEGHEGERPLLTEGLKLANVCRPGTIRTRVLIPRRAKAAARSG